MIVNQVAFSRSGEYLAAISVDGVLHVWESNSQVEIGRLSIVPQIKRNDQERHWCKSFVFFGDHTLGVVGDVSVIVVSMKPSTNASVTTFLLQVDAVVAPPCKILCSTTFADSFILGTVNGGVNWMNTNGVVSRTCTYPGLSDLTQIVAYGDTLLIGTDSGQLAVCNMQSSDLLSLYEHPSKLSVTHLAVDNTATWFVCVVRVNAYQSELIVGNCKCLATVFRSDPLDFVTHAHFARMNPHGMVVATSGPTPFLQTYSLDFSQSFKRIHMEQLEGGFCATASSNGLIAVGGVGVGIVNGSHGRVVGYCRGED